MRLNVRTRRSNRGFLRGGPRLESTRGITDVLNLPPSAETPMNPVRAELPLYVAGSWRPSSSAPIEVYDPRNEGTLASLPTASAAEVHEALSAAKLAQPDWAR